MRGELGLIHERGNFRDIEIGGKGLGLKCCIREPGINPETLLLHSKIHQNILTLRQDEDSTNQPKVEEN